MGWAPGGLLVDCLLVDCLLVDCLLVDGSARFTTPARRAR